MSDAKTTPLHLRVFLASPGDLGDERALVRHLLKDELPYEPFLRGRVTFDIVSWDDPAAPTPLPADLTPQEAVIRFETKPSECDIVIVVLWSRLGTCLDLNTFKKANGEPYLSGTEWEYEDACKGKTDIFIYRRTEEPKVGLKALDLAEQQRQYQLVGQFCERISRKPDGSFRGNVTDYVTPTAFKERLATDLKRLLRDRLGERNVGLAVAEAPVWKGSPYPGLRAFTPDEGPIFFGRGREIDALITRLRDPTQRFLAVVGASGTGKSSLVRAGLIPRLQDGAIEGSHDWRVVTCTPGALGDNPFLALAAELARVLPAQVQKQPFEIAMALAKAPQAFSNYVVPPAGGVVLLFVDQLEELFTHAATPYREPFAALLAHAVAQPHFRVVATLRADFLPQAMAAVALAPLLQAGTVPLGPPGLIGLAEMIRKPAERAGLELEDGLADEILKDAGTDPGALPLMAFCLEELYKRTVSDHRLTVGAYVVLGRLHGAISRRAEALLEELRETVGAALDAALPRVFQSLVYVDATGTATRRRAFQDEMGDAVQIRPIIDKLVKGRLLAAENAKDAEGADGRATVTLAHEALLLKWPALREWLDCNRVQLQRVQTLLAALVDTDEEVRRSAAKALGKLEPVLAAAAAGPAAVAAVSAQITALRDVNVRVRQSAARTLGTLGQIGSATAEVVPALINALGDIEREVRQTAILSLTRIGPAAAEAVPALITTLRDADEGARMDHLGGIHQHAAWALGRIGPAAAEAVPALITTLRDADEDVEARGNAAAALGLIGPATVEVVPVLINALGDAAKWVRASAAEGLGQIGPVAAKAVPALMAALQDPDQEVIKAAKEALERIQSASPAANST